MTEKKFTLQDWELSFARPVKVADQLLQKRGGVHILLNGEIVSELSPLPGLHKESLSDARAQLEAVLFEGLSGPLMPSVQFAVDGINLPPQALMSGPQTNALYIPSLGDEQLRPWQSLLANQHPVLKVKVGRLGLAQEKEILAALVQDLETQVLRLDGNNSLDEKQLLEILSVVPREKIEYVESPLRDDPDFALWNRLQEKLDVPLAIDEEVRAWFDGVIRPKGLKAIVLKPQLIGGLRKCQLLARKASVQKLAVVISSCFEGPTGLGLLATYADDLNEWPVIHGLSTLSLFENL